MTIDRIYPPCDNPTNHNDWQTALHCAEVTCACATWLPHIGHELDCWLAEQAAAKHNSRRLARDDVVVHIPGDTH